MGLSYSLVKRPRRRKNVRRRARRRNMSLPVHRGAFGVFVSDRGSSKKISVIKRKRRKKARAGVKKSGRRAARRKRNPFRRRRSARRRRNVLSFGSLTRKHGKYAHVAGTVSRRHPGTRKRRRRAKARRNPFRRRRSGRNPGVAVYGRRHRRRKSHFGSRRRNPGLVGTFRDIFTMDTGKQVIAGTVGLSASLWGPKLAGHLLWAPLGRGWGGVATSVVTTGLVSWLVGKVAPGQSKGVFIGGLIGSLAGALSALHCGIRTQVLPFETGLLACALPTRPSAGNVAGVLAAANIPNPTNPSLNVLGLPLGQAPAGMSGYGGGNYPAMNNLLSNEQAWRSAAGGMNDYVQVQVPGGMRDYVQQIQAGGQGMRDYASFASSGSSSGMDSSPESF